MEDGLKEQWAIQLDGRKRPGGLSGQSWRGGLGPGPAMPWEPCWVVWNWSWARWEATDEFLSDKWSSRRRFRECTCTWVGLWRIGRWDGVLGGDGKLQTDRINRRETAVIGKNGGVQNWGPWKGKRKRGNRFLRFEAGSFDCSGDWPNVRSCWLHWHLTLPLAQVDFTTHVVYRKRRKKAQVWNEPQKTTTKKENPPRDLNVFKKEETGFFSFHAKPCTPVPSAGFPSAFPVILCLPPWR